MDHTAEKDGVIFVATGDYSRAAVKAAESVRKFCPTLGLQLFTDHADVPTGAFDRVSPIKNPHMRSKVDFLPHTIFERTLYLDTDIRIVEDIREIFSLLDRFDIAVAHAHARNQPSTNDLWRCRIPESFPQMNSGVILYKNTPPVMRMLTDWGISYHEAGFKKDQVTLRELLWSSDLRIATLPPEYNIRSSKYLKVWVPKEARPKILHYARFHTDLGLTSKAAKVRWQRRLKRICSLLGINHT
jgi:hypothetical protein